MASIVGLCKKSLREEGFVGFCKRIRNWIRGYVAWKRIMIRRWLGKNVSWFDTLLTILWARARGFKKFRRFEKIVNGLEYSKEKGFLYKVISESEKTAVAAPAYFEGEGEKTEEYHCPAVYFSVFENAFLYGGSDMMAIGDTAVSDIYVRNLGDHRYNIFGGCIIKVRNDQYILIMYKNLGKIVDHAISMVGWGAANYYHFTFEILSRLAYADQYEEYRDWPILVDREALDIAQMRALLDRVNVWKHPVIPVAYCECVSVGKLAYVSHNMWMPPNFAAGAKQYASDFLFSHTVADHIRNAVLADTAQVKGDGYKKIFLSRKRCENQRLVNSVEVEGVFAENGYEIIYPEQLGFAEEVAVFHEADIIAGPTGAALTNLVYCKEGAVVVAIAPASHNLYCFSNIAHFVGVKFMVLDAEVVEKKGADSTDKFVLDKEKALRCIKSLER